MNLYHPIKIGSLSLPGNLFLAPVAGYSDRAFRYVCYEGGADFGYTEMVSSEALFRGSDKTGNLMLRASNEKHLAVQIFGGNPETMAGATEIIIDTVKPSLIDINAGCPVPKIVKTGAGSSLTRNPEKLREIVQSVNNVVVKKGLDIPVTVKIRSGWDMSNLTWREAAMQAVEGGAKAVSLHARTKAQGYEGAADWTLLAELVKVMQPIGIPVFGSGDVFSPENAVSMLKQTGCDGVMFARGAMGNPFIFRQTQQLIETGSYDEIPLKQRLETGLEELEILVNDIGEVHGCREMRKRFCGYTKGIIGGSAVRKLVVSAETIEDYNRIVKTLVAKN